MQGPVIELDLGAYAANLRLLSTLGGAIPLMPVIKANAYGHGAVILAKFLESEFTLADMPKICVARWSEAEKLRLAGVKWPILVLSQFSKEEILASSAKEIFCYLSSEQDFRMLLSVGAAKSKNVAGVYWHINSGMNRLGLNSGAVSERPDSLRSWIQELGQIGIKTFGFSSHLARGEEEQEIFSSEQSRRFQLALHALRSVWEGEDPFPQELHFSNSAGVVWKLLEGETAFRPGILSYGTFQDLDSKKYLLSKFPTLSGLKPVMQVRAPIRSIHLVKKGEGVSYGHRFVADKDRHVACISIGYADGIRRSLSRKIDEASKLKFYVDGVGVDIIGTVTMDMVLVDIQSHPKLAELQKKVAEGQTVWANWLCKEQPAEVHATELGTISYEILCDFTERLTRRPLGGDA